MYLNTMDDSLFVAQSNMSVTYKIWQNNFDVFFLPDSHVKCKLFCNNRGIF